MTGGWSVENGEPTEATSEHRELPPQCDDIHRHPEGPNEDIAICPKCWSPTYTLRPEGETFGWHSPDCSLPMRHESYCKPGGNGHPLPDGHTVRGYFPPTEVA